MKRKTKKCTMIISTRNQARESERVKYRRTNQSISNKEDRNERGRRRDQRLHIKQKTIKD